MKRCFDLANLGAGSVSPNPMVGAVLVYKDRIIGEGFHEEYGKAHAEVNAVNSVQTKEKHLIKDATLYVSLEPCCIFGKTPPCTQLILDNKIKKVVIATLDKTPGVAGNGVKILEKAGIEVETNVLEKEGAYISRYRNTLVSKNRPYIILKFAKSSDGFMGNQKEQVWISNLFSKRYAHKGRSGIDAILIGTSTAKIDDPQLTNRYYFGKSPLRIVLDKDLKLSAQLKIYDDSVKTWIVTEQTENFQHSAFKQTYFIQLSFDENLLKKLMERLAEEKISSLLIEGGKYTLDSFLKLNLWDEAMVFRNKKMIYSGIKGPDVSGQMIDEYQIDDDELTFYSNPNS